MKAATAAKATSRETANVLLRGLIKRIEGKPNVPNALINELGMSVRDTNPTRIEPAVPLNLAVIGSPFGYNTLIWDKNGNTSGAMFIVEAAIGSATTFSYVGQTSVATFKHIGQIPGVKVIYRVKATRTRLESDYSLTVTAYDTLEQAA